MIGHITALNLGLHEGVLTDFHGHQFKFDLKALPAGTVPTLGQELYFTPTLTAAGLAAISLQQHHHDGTRVVVPPVYDSSAPQFVRIGDVVIKLAQIKAYELTTVQNEIRNGYESRARHLVIQMKGGRQFNFYNWDGINIDDVMRTLKLFHPVNQKSS